jgi:hypothetical protein
MHKDALYMSGKSTTATTLLGQVGGARGGGRAVERASPSQKVTKRKTISKRRKYHKENKTKPKSRRKKYHKETQNKTQIKTLTHILPPILPQQYYGNTNLYHL